MRYGIQLILLAVCMCSFGQPFSPNDAQIIGVRVKTASAIPGIFVDSVSGSDANAGTSNSPFATLAKVVSVTGGSANTNIYLKRGSVFRESFAIPTNASISSYGLSWYRPTGIYDGLTNNRPIISGATQLVNGAFSLVAGQSNTYQYAFTPTFWSISEGGSTITCSNVCMMWENNVRLGRPMQTWGAATNLNMVITNKPSWWYDQGNHLIYVHSGDDSDPSTNSRIYEASVRRLVLYSGTNITLYDLQAEKGYEDTPAHSLNEFSGMGSGSITKCIFRMGFNHLAGVANTVDNKSPLVFDSCVFADNDPWNGGGGPTAFVAYKDQVTAPFPETYVTNCSAYQNTFDADSIGYFAHHSTGGSFSTCTISNSYAMNYKYGASANYPSEDLIVPFGFTALYCQEAIHGGGPSSNSVGITTYKCGISLNGAFTNISLSRIYDATNTSAVQLSGLYANASTLFYSNLVQGSSTYALTVYPYSSVQSFSNIFSGLGTIYNSSPTSTTNVVTAADYNRYFGYGSSFNANNPTNCTYTAWLAGWSSSLDPNSLTTDPGIVVPIYPTNYVISVAADIPMILNQPMSQTILLTNAFALTCTATGFDPLTYQWTHAGTNLSSGTTTAYTIAAVTNGDEGDYACIVTNTLGSVTSALATLTITQPYVFSPTNITGYPSLGWWCVSSNYTTNSSVVSLGNLYLANSGTDLTNMAAASLWPTRQAGAVNGLDAIYFNSASSGNYLKNINIARAQPFEIAMVVCLTNYGSGNWYVWSTTNSTQSGFVANPNTGFIPYAGNTFSKVADMITNKWFILDNSYNTTLATYTNNTAVAAGNGANGLNGFTLMQRYDLTGPSRGLIAEVAAYATNLSAVARSNLFNHWTNKYNLAP